ncbi:MAG: HlyD family efflux transporter periplasmic adaptor subunit [Polyangiaceae bacterium]
MDIPRTPKRRRFRIPAAVAVTLAMALVALAATRTLRSASPSVSKNALIVATVKRGAFEREVRAAGRLVPQETRWVTAITPGRVDEIMQKPGATVSADTVILKLQNPDVLLASLEADRDVTTAEASALELETRLGAQAITEEATVASLEAELSNAERRSAVYGADLGLVVPKLDQTQMADRAQSLSRSLDLAKDRVKLVSKKGQGAIAAWKEQLVRRKKVADFRRMQVEALAVRAGAQGVLVDIAVEPGQWAPPGAVLASVVQPDRLKAELRVPEGQAKDVMIGMTAQIDTHTGLIPGTVTRVAAAARDGVVLVEIALEGPLPAGSRPQLNIDGNIRIETIPDAVFVDRPASVYEAGPARLYRLTSDGEHAERTVVTMGRSSALSMEVKSGLAQGDRVIVSDTSTFEGDRVDLH